MSWHYSRALVEEYSAATCSDGVQSAQLSANHTPQAYLCKDRMTAFSRLSRFGMTFAPLTESLGADLLTWFLADSRVRTYQLLGMGPALMASAPACGEKWRESSVRYDLGSSSWKIHLSLFPEDLPWSSVTLPKWGMTRSGALFQHPTAERPISGNVAGLWPTITVHGNHNQPGSSKNAGWGLSSAVKQWPTPTATLATKGGRVTPRKSREGGTLIEAVSARSWPTPCASASASASASKGSSPASLIRKSGKSRVNDRIDHAVMASDGGQLNPEWVEWLMGWPIGWTELKPLAMDKFREWQQQHSPCSRSTTTDAA